MLRVALDREEEPWLACGWHILTWGCIVGSARVWLRLPFFVGQTRGGTLQPMEPDRRLKQPVPVPVAQHGAVISGQRRSTEIGHKGTRATGGCSVSGNTFRFSTPLGNTTSGGTIVALHDRCVDDLEGYWRRRPGPSMGSSPTQTIALRSSLLVNLAAATKESSALHGSAAARIGLLQSSERHNKSYSRLGHECNRSSGAVGDRAWTPHGHPDPAPPPHPPVMLVSKPPRHMPEPLLTTPNTSEPATRFPSCPRIVTGSRVPPKPIGRLPSSGTIGPHKMRGSQP